MEFRRHQKPCPIYDGITRRSFVYFVHSYYLDAENRSDVATKTEYGISFDSSVAVPEINLYATQFHPEKSGRVGLKILEILRSSEVTHLYAKGIPCLDVKNGRVVKGVSFVNLRDAGDPCNAPWNMMRRRRACASRYNRYQ